jgi:hypothetical protein
MRPLLARPGTIFLFAFLFLFSNLATTVLIADPIFSNTAFAQQKKQDAKIKLKKSSKKKKNKNKKGDKDKDKDRGKRSP